MFDPWLVVDGKLLFIGQKFLTECFQPVVDDCSWEITFHWSKFLKTEYFQPVDGCREGGP